MRLEAGAKLGPYEILALIGARGIGQVWKARDTRLDRIVAIKVAEEKFSERFEREARTVAALNHPRICTLYDGNQTVKTIRLTASLVFAALALLALMAGSAEATPFTYEFILPNWTEVGGDLSEIFGTYGIITLTVDNGLISPAPQYTFAEVKEIQFFAPGMFGGFTLLMSDPIAQLGSGSSLTPTDIALTTDVAGFGYLDFSKNDLHVAFWSSCISSETSSLCKTAMFHYGTNRIAFSASAVIFDPPVGHGGSAIVSDLSLVQSSFPVAVPEPASLLLLVAGSGSISLRIWWRHQSRVRRGKHSKRK